LSPRPIHEWQRAAATVAASSSGKAKEAIRSIQGASGELSIGSR